MSARRRGRGSAAPDALGCALAAVAKNWPVLPLKPRSKEPILPWRELVRRAPDAEEVRRWFREFPGCNYGVATGVVSSVVVIDIDSAAGAETLRSLGLIPSAYPHVQTGRSDGCHVYAAVPQGGLRSTRGSVDGVDVRGDGGYVVGPGSRHESGRVYRASPGFFDATLPDLPAPLVAALRASRPEPGRPTQATLQPLQPCVDVSATPYGATALCREIERLASSVRPGRNDILNTTTFRLFRLVAGGELSEGPVLALLESAAERCGLVSDDGWDRVQRTIASGQRDGLESPRRAPSSPPDVARAEARSVCSEARAALASTPDGHASGLTPARRRMVLELIRRCEATGKLLLTIPRDEWSVAAKCDPSTISRALREQLMQRWMNCARKGGARWDGHRVSMAAPLVQLQRPHVFGEHAPISTSHFNGGMFANNPVTIEPLVGLDRLSRVAQALAAADGPVMLKDLAHLGPRRTLADDVRRLADMGAVAESALRTGEQGRPAATWQLLDGGLQIVARHLAEVEARQHAARERRTKRLYEQRAKTAELLVTVNDSADRPAVRAKLDAAVDAQGGLSRKGLDEAHREALASRRGTDRMPSRVAIDNSTLATENSVSDRADRPHEDRPPATGRAPHIRLGSTTSRIPVGQA